MEERVARTIRNIDTFEGLAQFETNAEKLNALNSDMKDAIRVRSTELGKALIASRTGLVLDELTPAETKIVEAVSEYVGVMKRQGKDAGRTFEQLRNRGLLESAETAVSRSTPTKGFQNLADADLSNLSYEQIVIDHPDEFSPRAIWYSRKTLNLPNDSPTPPASTKSPIQTRTETLLSWLGKRSGQNGGTIPPYTNADAAAVLGMADMHRYGRAYGNIQSRIDFGCYKAGLPPLGLTADAPFQKAWGQEHRDWAYPIAGMQAAAKKHSWTEGDYESILEETERLPGQAYLVWDNEPENLIKAWAFGLASDANDGMSGDGPTSDSVGLGDAQATAETQIDQQPYWVFVCNPKKWAIDRFLDRSVEHDSWGVRPSDRNRFAPGQLGIVRVGVDRRTIAERDGKPPLVPGIYALCEVESEAFDGTGAGDEFWVDGEGREPGWPTVKLRYIKTYLPNPLTIERLRTDQPNLSSLLLNGFQAASFPISGTDFRTVATLLGVDLDDLEALSESADVTPEKLAALEKKYLHASPEVKERVSRSIERGPVGRIVKKAVGFKCQLCEALGLTSSSFLKLNGEPYVEAHHVMPVANQQVGSLAVSNIMILCANHHRQMHYGNVEVVIGDTLFELLIDGKPTKIGRFGLSQPH